MQRIYSLKYQSNKQSRQEMIANVTKRTNSFSSCMLEVSVTFFVALCHFGLWNVMQEDEISKNTLASYVSLLHDIACQQSRMVCVGL